MKCYLHNLGCSKNQIDGEVFAGAASRSGLQVTNEPESADVIVINTCAFIQEAKEEAIEAILEAAELKKLSPGKRLYVCGCFPQRHRKELEAELPEVDGFFGVHQWNFLLQTLSGEPISPSLNPFLLRELGTPSHYAYIRIADGCQRGCTYCVIPEIRGKYISRRSAEIVEEAKNLAQRGVKELLPVAQELNSYGHDLGPGRGDKPLISLLTELCRVEGIEWIRPLYLHPPAVSEPLLEFWASRPKMCPYLDLPVEHASDRILKAMGRGGSRRQMRRIIETARRLMPDVVIRTSIIVGFPGETDADFRILLDFVREVRFDRLGSFRFSAEEGTPAAALPDQVPEDVKQTRQEELMAVQMEISEEINRERVGDIETVFVDRFEEESGYSIAHSRKELPESDGEILIKGRYPVGAKLTVRISSAAEYDLFAEPVGGNDPDRFPMRLSAEDSK